MVVEIRRNDNEGISIICLATLTRSYSYMQFLTKRAEIYLILFDYALTKRKDTNCDLAQVWSIIKKPALKHVDWKIIVIEIFNCHIPVCDTWDSVTNRGKIVSMAHSKNYLDVMSAGYSYRGKFENSISYSEVKTKLIG